MFWMVPILFLLLGSSPSAAEEKQARADSLGDPLPPGAVARLGTLRLRPRCWAPGTDFSPDGKLLACVGEGPHIRLWETASGKEVPRIALAPTGPFRKVKFSPTGQILAAGTWGEDPELFLWDTATGKLLHRLHTHAEASLVDMAFADGGKSLLGVDDAGTARWWSVATGVKVREWEVRSIEKLAGSGGLEELEYAHLTPDGRVLAAVVRCSTKFEGTFLRRVVVWDLERRKHRWQLDLEKDAPSLLSLSSDGRVAAVADGAADISLRDGVTGRELRRLRGWGEGLALSPDGKLLAGLASGPVGVRVWDTGSGKVVHEICGKLGYDLGSPLFSPDGKRLLFPWRGTLALWDVDSWTERPRLPGHREPVFFLSFSADGKTLVSDSANPELDRSWPTEALTWDTTTWSEVSRNENVSLPGLLSRTHDHRLGIVHDRGDFFLARLPGGQRLRQLDIHSDHVDPRTGFFSPSGRTAVQLSDQSGQKSFVLVDVTTGKRWGSLPESVHPLSVTFAPDDRTLAWVDSEAVIHVAAVDGCKELRRLGKPRPGWARVRARPILALSPAGPQLAFWERESDAIAFWDWQTGRELGRVQGDRPLAVLHGKAGHLGPVLALAFSPDGRLLASGSRDTTILVWDLHGRPSGKPARPEALWAELASADAARADEAMTALLQQPSVAVALLAEKLEPASTADDGKIARLIADLDNDDFERRERAERGLEELADRAEAGLRRTLLAGPSVEVRRRIGHLLDKLQRLPPGRLRLLRAVEVLEHLGTREARRVLRRLAEGVADDRMTREARGSLERLERPATGRPESR